jgi:hypothetical protein
VLDRLIAQEALHGVDPDRLVELALIVERYAQAAKISSILSVLFYCLTDQFDGQVMPSSLMRNDPEQVQSVRVVRLGRKHAPVTRLRLGQAARLVVLEPRP